MGIEYSTKATYGSPISEELLDKIAAEVYTQEQIDQGFGVDLPYEFNEFFGLDCEDYGDAMSGDIEYIVGYTAFNINMRYDGGACKPVELEAGDDDRVLSDFVKKYGLERPTWYAGMLIH